MEKGEEVETTMRRLEQKLATMGEELKRAKEENAKIITRMEQEEEHITLTLLKKLRELKLDHEKLANQTEAESEHLALTLARQVKQLQMEKAAIAAETEVEEEHRTNMLQRRLSQLESERKTLLGISDENSCGEVLKAIKSKLLGMVVKKDINGSNSDEDESSEPDSQQEQEPRDQLRTLREIDILASELGRRIEREEMLMQDIVRERDTLARENTALTRRGSSLSSPGVGTGSGGNSSSSPRSTTLGLGQSPSHLPRLPSRSSNLRPAPRPASFPAALYLPHRSPHLHL